MNETALEKIRNAKEYLERAERALLEKDIQLSLGNLDSVEFEVEAAKCLLRDDLKQRRNYNE
ncbi:hypothetical protein BCB4_0141 [Bacillus phage B4]|uniref:Uncharacterized protein n=4 Tax=Bequatrovirus TaxID=1917990 RepID=A0A1X9SGI4_9CAUD|nr:hypothetical protein BCB4_0141 [Bacillus phage B4]YP_008770424.1 hypothetical protein Spock_200 [Bacillus phage Spock]YP_009783732.1 hypothetical protein QLX26_gp136 [Bacillus phage B5S]ARQ95130.1 hypothetical protein FLAPJACK_205 [Bacillus phage Flapjack]AEW47370.1 hypothetical protein B5S_0136 [Bacillus phage B5S]AEZ65934.1 hypothetical protein BCB4_0141 [Bacillus phage B4]AGY48600.1 hypothetical protein Spock_200 [Bacillus phage Spock]